MKKWLAGMIFIVMIVLILVVLVIFNLGTIVKMAVNTYGPRLAKTEMRLSSADVSLMKAQAQLENFVLGNPEGFSSPHAITVGSITVDVDESTLARKTIIINRIEVTKPEITYEIREGTDNFRTIMDRMKSADKSGQKADKPKPSEKKGEQKTPKKSGKKVIIRDLIIKDIKVRTVGDIFGGEIFTMPLPDLHLKNIGKKQEGLSIPEAFLLVINDLYKQILSLDILGSVKKQFKGIEGTLENVGKELETLGGHLKKWFE